jgi:hypothetical protein
MEAAVDPQSEWVISTLKHRIKVPLPNMVFEAYSPLCRHLVTKRFDGNGPPPKRVNRLITVHPGLRFPWVR